MIIQNESSGRDRNRNGSAEAEADKAEIKQNLWVSTGKTFRINRVYTAGVTACGSALVGIAGAAEGEGFQKVASFIHKWVCGGNSTGQTPAEIQALCNDYLVCYESKESENRKFVCGSSSLGCGYRGGRTFRGKRNPDPGI